MPDNDNKKQLSPRHLDKLRNANDVRREAAKLRNQECENTVMKLLGDEKAKRIEYSDEIAEEILVRVASGQSLKYIASLDNMPAFWTLQKWLYGYQHESEARQQQLEPFRRAYARAQQASVQLLADEMLDIAEEAIDKDSASSAKVRIEVRQWLCERRSPRLFAPAQQRVIEEDIVEDFATKTADAIKQIQERREQRLAEERGSTEEVLDATYKTLPQATTNTKQ